MYGLMLNRYENGLRLQGNSLQDILSTHRNVRKHGRLGSCTQLFFEKEAGDNEVTVFSNNGDVMYVPKPEEA